MQNGIDAYENTTSSTTPILLIYTYLQYVDVKKKAKLLPLLFNMF